MSVRGFCMRTKYLAVGLAVSVLLNVFLVKDIEKRPSEYCERIHTDDIDMSKNVIPNEMAAIKIAEIKLSKERMGGFGLVEELEYNVDVSYDEALDEWRVSFRPKNTNVVDGGATIWLSGAYGVMNDFRR